MYCPMGVNYVQQPKNDGRMCYKDSKAREKKENHEEVISRGLQAVKSVCERALCCLASEDDARL